VFKNNVFKILLLFRFAFTGLKPCVKVLLSRSWKKIC